MARLPGRGRFELSTRDKNDKKKSQWRNRMYKDTEVRQFVSRETSTLWGRSRVGTGCVGHPRPNSRPLMTHLPGRAVSTAAVYLAALASSPGPEKMKFKTRVRALMRLVNSSESCSDCAMLC